MTVRLGPQRDSIFPPCLLCPFFPSPEDRMKRTPIAAFVVLVGCAACVGCQGLLNVLTQPVDVETKSEYHTPKDTADDGLVDDRLEDKTRPPFDPDLVDRR